VNLEARIAIEALRAGVPNRAAVRLMGTEEPTLEHKFDEQLHQVWASGRHRPGLGLAGGFGSGKSHFLGYLAEVARAQHFVVSRVPHGCSKRPCARQRYPTVTMMRSPPR